MASDHSSTDVPADDLKRRKAPIARVVGEIFALSPWRKALLTLFAVVAAAGSVMWVHGRLNATPVAVEREPAPAYASDDGLDLRDDGETAVGQHFLGGDAAAAPRGFELEPVNPDSPAAESTETEPQTTLALPWTGRLGGWMFRLGLSFVLGLVLGIFFRTFLKTMAVVTAVIVGAIVVASYFDVLPIDFSKMRANYDSAAGYLKGQADGIKAFAMTFLPSATAGGFGFFVGFLRRG